MSYRELWVFLRYLPAESRTQTALRDQPRDELDELPQPAEPVFGPWSLLNQQMADLIDATERNTAVTAWAADKKDYPKPKPVPRPGHAKSRPKELPPAAKKYLEGLRATG